ncbi:MAG: hypothetical protein F3741_12125 [Nitrospinae bacterium]|nr:hypothetical protein [Nitrospinota bacterium]
MENQNLILISLALAPIIVGVMGRVLNFSFSSMKFISLATISILGLTLVFSINQNPSIKFLVLAVLLMGFCVMICQEKLQQTSEFYFLCLVTIGLTLGAIMGQELLNRLFLCSLLGFMAFSIAQQKKTSPRKTFTLIHFAIASILPLGSIFGGESLKELSRLFLALTFLPLIPFHLPFSGVVDNGKGALSSLWLVVWLALGLAELNIIYSSLSKNILISIGFLALITAFYASLAALGQKKANPFIAAATVAYVSIIWGLLNVFPNFPKWGIAFGVAVAFVLGGISLAFSFVKVRYGWQTIGKLPGLADPMPRLGTVMVLLVSFALFLPMIPTFTGLIVMPTIETLDVNFIKIFFIFFAVWLGGGWFLLQMLHQTAFGSARENVPYSDLCITEYIAVMILLLGAVYSGLLY